MLGPPRSEAGCGLMPSFHLSLASHPERSAAASRDDWCGKASAWVVAGEAATAAAVAALVAAVAAAAKVANDASPSARRPWWRWRRWWW